MKKLSKLHRDAITLILAGDLTMDEIAVSVKKTRKTLYNWMKDPVFAEELEERRQQQANAYKARLARNAGYALERAKKILKDSEDDRAAASVISDTLDRAGFPKHKAIDLKHEAEIKGGGVILIPEPLTDEEAENGGQEN